jgi:RNA polymerase sigma-70 factor (ECF subfamily)
MTDFDANSPDGMLVAAALAGHEQALALLAGRYQAALFRVALSRLGNRQLAEEAVQETLLCAHRWLSTYDSRFTFRTWLWTILLNQCARQAKREARQQAVHAEASRQVAAAGASPLAELLARERSEQVHELLSRLPTPQADALRLRFFAGLTFPEIAAAMRCSEPGAKHRVKTGLLKLARWLRSPAECPADGLGEDA